MTMDPHASPAEGFEPDPLVRDFLDELAAAPITGAGPGGLPDDFEDLPTFDDSGVDPDNLPQVRLDIIPAPSVLDARVALATGVPLVALRGRETQVAGTRSRPPYSWRAAIAAAACLIGGLWLFGAEAALLEQVDRAPRLVIVDVDEPIDTSFDPLAFGIWLASKEGRKR